MIHKNSKTKECILECAEKIFSSNGYYITRISDIVKIAQVARGTIYLYFENKDDIFKTLIDRYHQELKKSIILDIDESSINSSSPYCSIEYLMLHVKKIANYLWENQDRMNIILTVAVGHSKDIEYMFENIDEKILNIIIGDIKLGQKMGTISKCIDVEIASSAILGIIIKLTHHFYLSKRNNYHIVNRQNLEAELLKFVASILGINVLDIVEQLTYQSSMKYN